MEVPQSLPMLGLPSIFPQQRWLFFLVSCWNIHVEIACLWIYFFFQNFPPCLDGWFPTSFAIISWRWFGSNRVSEPRHYWQCGWVIPCAGAVLHIAGCLKTFFGVRTSDNSTLLSKSWHTKTPPDIPQNALGRGAKSPQFGILWVRRTYSQLLGGLWRWDLFPTFNWTEGWMCHSLCFRFPICYTKQVHRLKWGQRTCEPITRNLLSTRVWSTHLVRIDVQLIF